MSPLAVSVWHVGVLVNSLEKWGGSQRPSDDDWSPRGQGRLGEGWRLERTILQLDCRGFLSLGGWKGSLNSHSKLEAFLLLPFSPGNSHSPGEKRSLGAFCAKPKPSSCKKPRSPAYFTLKCQ